MANNETEVTTPKEFWVVLNLKNDRFPASQFKLHSTEKEATEYAQKRFSEKPFNTYYVMKTVLAVHPLLPSANVTRLPIKRAQPKRAGTR